jgi:outer membrane protein assembly factor BamD (BamD/ComL family)
MKFLYVFIFTLFMVGLQAGRSNSMMPKENPFKKKHKPTERLKFSDKKPEIENLAELENSKILKGQFRGNEQKRKFDDLSLSELRDRKIQYVNSSEKEIAVKYIEKMMILCQDQRDLKDLRLELANLYFDLEDYEKSGKAYSDYVANYPNDMLTEFAAFREILCLDLRKTDPDRDQLMTKEAILKAKQFIKNEQFRMYRKGVIDILQDSYRILLDNEIYIFRFYLNIRKNARAAEKRLDYIKKEVFPYIENSEKIEKELEGQLQALKDGRIREFNRELKKENEKVRKLEREQKRIKEQQERDQAQRVHGIKIKTKPHRDKF